MLDIKIQKKHYYLVVLAIISNTYMSIQMTTNSNIGISIYTKKTYLFFTCSEYCIANAHVYRIQKMIIHLFSKFRKSNKIDNYS